MGVMKPSGDGNRSFDGLLGTFEGPTWVYAVYARSDRFAGLLQAGGRGCRSFR